MTESEFLERIDDHIAATRHHVAVANRQLARGNELFERFIVLHEDTREFIRKMSIRNERWADRVVAQIDDQRDLIRKQTEGLMRILDRLDEGSQPAS